MSLYFRFLKMQTIVRGRSKPVVSGRGQRKVVKGKKDGAFCLSASSDLRKPQTAPKQTAVCRLRDLGRDGRTTRRNKCVPRIGDDWKRRIWEWRSEGKKSKEYWMTANTTECHVCVCVCLAVFIDVLRQMQKSRKKTNYTSDLTGRSEQCAGRARCRLVRSCGSKQICRHTRYTLWLVQATLSIVHWFFGDTYTLAVRY